MKAGAVNGHISVVEFTEFWKHKFSRCVNTLIERVIYHTHSPSAERPKAECTLSDGTIWDLRLLSQWELPLQASTEQEQTSLMLRCAETILAVPLNPGHVITSGRKPLLMRLSSLGGRASRALRPTPRRRGFA